MAVQYRLMQDMPLDVALAGVFEAPYQRSKDLLDGQEVFEGLLIVSRDLGEHSNVCLNLKFGKDGDEDVKEWALGAKTPISEDPHGIAAGVEILGCFEEFEDSWSVLPGVYMPLGADNIILKSGLELGKDMGSSHANLTLMYRF